MVVVDPIIAKVSNKLQIEFSPGPNMRIDLKTALVPSSATFKFRCTYRFRISCHAGKTSNLIWQQAKYSPKQTLGDHFCSQTILWSGYLKADPSRYSLSPLLFFCSRKIWNAFAVLPRKGEKQILHLHPRKEETAMGVQGPADLFRAQPAHRFQSLEHSAPYGRNQ